MGGGSGAKGKPAKFAKAIQEIDEAVEVKTGSKPAPLVGTPAKAKGPAAAADSSKSDVTLSSKKRKLSGSSEDAGSRRKSARENGHDKASGGSSQTNAGSGDKVVVKEANTPEVEIVETLKVKIKPRSTPKKPASADRVSNASSPVVVKKSASEGSCKPTSTLKPIPEK